MRHRVTKTFGHDFGLSCVFRQWKAESHCNKLHGYAISVSLTFEASELTREGWVIDFGSFAEIKHFLKETFDHTLLISQDDPKRESIIALAKGVADVRVLRDVGCEAFCRLIAEEVQGWLSRIESKAVLAAVRVAEHSGNAAETICTPFI